MTAIAERAMTSDVTPHTARRIAVRPGQREYWRSSWCPHLALDRNQAITAMTVAELLTPPAVGHPGLLKALTDELGVTVEEAVAAVDAPPHVLDTRFHTLSLSCWCEPVSAIDGHRNPDGSEPEFAASDTDTVDGAGRLLEVVPR
ncbi:hypothetical protein GCM10027258_62140 [Amycolatopsis stemonae]